MDNGQGRGGRKGLGGRRTPAEEEEGVGKERE